MIVQTTAIDPEVLIRLTTVLVHSSGEWVSLRLAGVPGEREPRRRIGWGGACRCPPLCPLHPGQDRCEDDLDEPGHGVAKEAGGDDGMVSPPQANGCAPASAPEWRLPKAASGRSCRLAPAESAAIRDNLGRELAGISSAEQLTDWDYVACRSRIG